MNWGVKIVIFLAAFMIFIIGSVIYMISTDTDGLEENDYYEQALNYDDTYDRKQNTRDDKAEPTLKIEEGELKIDFTTSIKKGNLVLRRLSDRSKDQNIDFSTDEKTYYVDLSKLDSGMWMCILTWENKGKEYLFEEDIFL